MWFKHKAWIYVSAVLSVGNVAAVWVAVGPGTMPLHATLHAAAAVLFALGAQHLRTRAQRLAGNAAGGGPTLDAMLRSADPEAVNQALDAIALEVERIGEGQRFLTKLLTERDARGRDAVPASKPPA